MYCSDRAEVLPSPPAHDSRIRLVDFGNDYFDPSIHEKPKVRRQEVNCYYLDRGQPKKEKGRAKQHKIAAQPIMGMLDGAAASSPRLARAAPSHLLVFHNMPPSCPAVELPSVSKVIDECASFKV